MGIALTPEDEVFCQEYDLESVALNTLRTLPSVQLETLFVHANECLNFGTLKKLRQLGFERTEPPLMIPGEPHIFGLNMDAIEVQETLDAWLKKKAQEGRLLTAEQFEQLDPSKWFQKINNRFGRLIGRDLIADKIQELGLTRVKVPNKIMVIDADEEIQLQIGPHLQFFQNGRVFAQKVESSKRAVTIDEITELLQLIEATGFGDIQRSNFVVAENGIYFIDTNADDSFHEVHFREGMHFDGMVNLVHALPDDQQRKELLDSLSAKKAAYLKDKQDHASEEAQRKQREKAAAKRNAFGKHRAFSFKLSDILSA